jgi:membrane protein YdbS with pleckstrin-like domain
MPSAYIENPQNCSFAGQDRDEKILLLLRAHPITNLPWIILAIFLFFLPFFLPLLLNLLTFNLSFIPESFRLTFLIINYLLVLVVVFEGFLFWYFNVYIVTNKNIVDIDFHSLLFRNIDVAPLRNVEDVSSSMGGILQALFHYGDVFVQTAGASKSVDFHKVPRPHEVADFILDQTHKTGGN